MTDFATFQFMFAPMEDYSDPELRELCYNGGADATFTEMTRVSGLARNNKSTLEKISIPKPIPTYIQIVGSNENDLKKFLDNFKPEPGFLGFNFNLGCPSPNITQRGLGCALIKRCAKVNSLVKLVKSYGYNTSIKLRLGKNQFEKEQKLYLKLINEVDADFFIVHARHGKERDRHPNDFSVYPECVATGKTIIANGDITTKEQIEYLKSIGVKGAMIGRPALKNQNIFNELK